MLYPHNLIVVLYPTYRTEEVSACLQLQSIPSSSTHPPCLTTLRSRFPLQASPVCDWYNHPQTTTTITPGRIFGGLDFYEKSKPHLPNLLRSLHKNPQLHVIHVDTLYMSVVRAMSSLNPMVNKKRTINPPGRRCIGDSWGHGIVHIFTKLETSSTSITESETHGYHIVECDWSSCTEFEAT